MSDQVAVLPLGPTLRVFPAAEIKTCKELGGRPKMLVAFRSDSRDEG
jgi:hypothetical protein